MAVVITSISPPRGRALDSIVITGTGFNAAEASNTVTVDGVAATVTDASGGTSVTATVPLGIAAGRQVEVEVTNTGTVESGSRWWHVVDPVASLLTQRQRAKQPFQGESPDTERDRLYQAQDFERLSAAGEAWMRDVLGGSGGAERIGTDATNFVTIAPAADTVDAALAAIDETIASASANVSERVVAAATEPNATSPSTRTAVVPVGTLAADTESIHVEAWGTGGPVTQPLRLTVFGTVLLDTNWLPNIPWKIKATIYRTGPSAALAMAAVFPFGETIVPEVVPSTSGNVVALAGGGRVSGIRIRKKSIAIAPDPDPEPEADEDLMTTPTIHYDATLRFDADGDTTPEAYSRVPVLHQSSGAAQNPIATLAPNGGATYRHNADGSGRPGWEFAGNGGGGGSVGMMATLATPLKGLRGEWWIVFRPDAVSSANATAVSVGDSPGNIAQQPLGFTATTGTIRMHFIGSGFSNVIRSTNAPANGQTHLWRIRSTGSAYEAWLNGTPETLVVVSGANDGQWVTAATLVMLGAYNAGGSPVATWDGRIMEVLNFDGSIIEADEVTFRKAQLATKWGLTLA